MKSTESFRESTDKVPNSKISMILIWTSAESFRESVTRKLKLGFREEVFVISAPEKNSGQRPRKHAAVYDFWKRKL